MTCPPFDASDADLTLRASDGTTFKVYSRILTVASPIFDDMFQLPQPDAEKDAPMHVVDVSESSEVMDTLLKYIYPIEALPVETLSLLYDLLVAANKYDMNSILKRLGRLLITPPKFVRKEPIRAYAIACRFGLDEEAKVASSYTLNINILDAPLPAELKYITGYDYGRLIALHRMRGQAAQNLITWDPTTPCSASHFCRPKDVPVWWADWSARAKAELLVRPSTDVVFSLDFLAQSREDDTCHGHILSWHGSLTRLKEGIDDLPNTI